MHPARRYSQKGGASAKGHFRRKYVFARPKYTAEKLHKIREVCSALAMWPCPTAHSLSAADGCVRR